MDYACPICESRLRIAVANDMLTDGIYLAARCTSCGYSTDVSALDDKLALLALSGRIDACAREKMRITNRAS